MHTGSEDKKKKTKMAENILTTVFSENQIALLSNKKKRVNWSREEIAIAFTLRYFSKKC
jgi:hypothetical protein